ncbi:MAG: tetratricopeptide repeat protein [Ignavibacteria bacterium]|nr:tetratricopeptide repeat protein [Ignavibacteria bacterium]
MGFSDTNYPDTGSEYLERRDLLSCILSSREILREGTILLNKPFLDEVIARCIEASRFKEALPIISQLVKLLPHDADLWLKRAECALALGKQSTALTAIRMAVSLDPGNWALLLQSGSMGLQLNQVNFARDCFERLLNIDSADFTLYQTIGIAYRENAHYDTALTYLLKALSYGVNKNDILFQIALCYDQQDDLYNALKYYDQYLFDASNCAVGWYNRANILERNGRLDEALESYQFAVSLDEAFVEAHFNLGNCYTDKAEYDEALKSFAKVLSLEPNNAAAVYNTAAIREQTKKYNEAITGYTACIELSSNVQNCFLSRGNCYLQSGNFEKALDDFRSSIMLDLPQITRYKYDTEKLQKLMPNLEKKIKAFEKKCDRNVSKSLEGLVTWYIIARKYNDAIIAIRKYTGLFNMSGEKFTLLALVYFCMGNSILGYATLSQAVHSGKKNIEIIKSIFPATGESKFFRQLFLIKRFGY